jgi:hypothetical protein
MVTEHVCSRCKRTVKLVNGKIPRHISNPGSKEQTLCAGGGCVVAKDAIALIGHDVTCRECGNPLTAIGPASGLCTACAVDRDEELQPIPLKRAKDIAQGAKVEVDRTGSGTVISEAPRMNGIGGVWLVKMDKDGKTLRVHKDRMKAKDSDPYIRDWTEYVKPHNAAEHEALGKRIQTSEIEARRSGDHEWKRNLDKLRARWIADMPTTTKTYDVLRDFARKVLA